MMKGGIPVVKVDDVRWSLAIVAAMVLVTLPFESSIAAPGKRALLIAIDEYEAVSDLNGAGNDVELMRSVLIGKFDFPEENVMILRDESATRDGILSTIRSHLIEPTETGDIVLLHYSGHGSRMPDVSGDEIDGFDETLVPHDARTRGVFDISDDELNALLEEIGEKTDNVTVVFDSCNSGSVTRGAVARSIPADKRTPPDTDVRSVDLDGAAIRPLSANYVLISGARYDEFANETIFGGKTYGAMTYHFANALMTAGPSLTYGDVMDRVKSKVNARFPTQHPQLEGVGMDTVVFGDQTFLTTPYVLVEPDGPGRVAIKAGLESGLSTGSELEVFAPGTRTFDDTTPVAKIKIRSSSVGRSNATIIGGGPVEAQSRATLTNRVFGDYKLYVWLDKSIRTDLRAEIQEALTNDATVQLIAEEASSLVRIVENGGSVGIESADQVALSPSVPVHSDDAAARIVAQVRDWARWYSLLDLDNPNPSFDIHLGLRRENDPIGTPGPATVIAGTKLHFRVRSTSDQTLFIYVLVLSADGSVTVLYPSQKGAEEGLPPGEVLEIRDLEPFVPNGRDSITDVLKVIATGIPINPQIFPQDAVRGGDTTKVSEAPLEQLIAHLSLGATRGFKAPGGVELSRWATSQISVETKRPVSRTLSFAVHTDSVDGAGTRGPATREICDLTGVAPLSADCINATALSADGDVLEVSLGATRGGQRPVFTPGQAFQDAYELRDELGVARVEPLIEADVSNNDELQSGTRSRGGDAPHDPLAAGDDAWSLKYVLADQAREKVRAKQDASEGSEATGVLIAHPDTGYRRHPELWETIEGRRPIRHDAGVDYVDRDSDPFDPLDESGLIANAGHGTASGSVIVSPDGCQLDDSEMCVGGVAPGAQLVPLRVHTSVVLLNQRNLVKALNDVADDKLEVKTPMVSIAMGGPPSWALWKAVKKAEKNGKLIIAAAGNNVGTVVWPARFSSTIAVAAINIRCKPWRGSSRGRAVDIAAPGESVWRATVDTNTEVDLIGMGRGTTFATGTTAGAAALWIAYHAGEPEFEQLTKSGRIVEAFRQAIVQSAWRPDTASHKQPAVTFCEDGLIWDARNYGAGIVNASALLDQPLEVTRQRTLHASTLADLPLVKSLYPDPINAAIVESDYRRLFGLEPGAEFETIAYFESEVVYHYAMNEAFRNRYDAIIGGARRDRDYALLRQALLYQDLSPRLRAALSP